MPKIHRRSQSDGGSLNIRNVVILSKSHHPSGDVEEFGRIRLFEVIFAQRSNFGLIFSYRSDKHVALISGFEFLAASLAGSLQIGDEVVACGAMNLDGLGKEETAHIIKNSPFPLTLRLRRRVGSPLKHCNSSPDILYSAQCHTSSSNSSAGSSNSSSSSSSSIIINSNTNNSSNASSNSSGSSNSSSNNSNSGVAGTCGGNSSSSGGSISSSKQRFQCSPIMDTDAPVNATPPNTAQNGSSRTEILEHKVVDISVLTDEIYQASLQLDAHNHMRHQATVMTMGAIERVPLLIETVDQLGDEFRATLARLEALEKRLFRP